MKIQSAIEKAIEGGWNPYGLNRTPEGIKDSIRFYQSVIFHKMLLNPAFWQALGKVEGWDDGRHDDPSYALVPENRWMWEHKWHRMIDALAGGKTIEQFFETL